MPADEQNLWKKCSSCKNPILLGARYYTCSVSTCNGNRTGYVFCSVACFEVHLPSARHKDAAALENKAPERARKIIASSAVSAPALRAGAIPRDVLIIASRLKEYILARSEMSTSGAVMDALSEHVRRVCDEAIDNARKEGRKTVLERDFDFLKR